MYITLLQINYFYIYITNKLLDKKKLSLKICFYRKTRFAAVLLSVIYLLLLQVVL